MRYEARFTAYDMLDQINVAIIVTGEDDDYPGLAVPAFTWGRQYAARGESDARRWVIQALEQALRDLQASEKRRATLDALTCGPHTVTDVADSVESENR
jgi:hypothetical protein